MQRINFRNIIGLFRHKIVLLATLLLVGASHSYAQLNYLEYTNKKIYFGITLGYNTTNYRLVHDDSFIFNDTVMEVVSTRGPGFNLGIVANLAMGKYFDLRAAMPTLTFSDKKLQYRFVDGGTATRTIQSILLDFPLMVRFKSQPIKDMRFYVLAGMKYSIDLASNAKARRADDQVKVGRHDLSYEYGLGIQIFFPLFIFSPEIKFSNGVLDVHSRNEDLIYSSVVDKLLSRTITVSLHFEG